LKTLFMISNLNGSPTPLTIFLALTQYLVRINDPFYFGSI